MSDFSLEDLLTPGDRRKAARASAGGVELAFGNDTTPLVALVRDEPSGWGKVTTDRSKSAAYAQFVAAAKRRNQQREAR